MHPIDQFVFDWVFPLAFVWGLLIFLSLAGWGQVCKNWLVTDSQDKNIEWGLTASWGMAVYVVAAGLMLMLDLFSTAFVALFLLTGLILLGGQICFYRIKIYSSTPPSAGLKLALVGFCLLVALTYTGAVAMRLYNENDDLAAYFPLIKMSLDTGTLSDPFSYRLLGALGGQLVLNALVAAFFPWKFTYLLEMGIMVVIMVALALELVRGQDAKAWRARLFIATFALTFPISRANTASELTGVVLFVALLQSLELITTGRCRGWRAAVLLGGLIAAISTLRCPYIFACALLCAGYLAWHLWKNRQDIGTMIGETLMIFTATTILVAPWWIVIYRSSGAFLYPLIKGTQQPDFKIITNALSPADTIAFMGGFLFSCNFLFLFLPVAFLKPGRERQLFVVLGALVFLFSMALLSQLTLAVHFDVYRYLSPLALAFCIYTLGALGRQYAAIKPDNARGWSEWRMKSAVILGAVILGSQLLLYIGPVFRNIFRIQWALNEQHDMWTNPLGPTSGATVASNYRKAFVQIPPASHVLIALDYPYLLDYRKNTIYSIDQCGGASPHPGYPYFKGPDAVKNYLLSQNIRYIAHVHFESSRFLHSRDAIKRNEEGATPVYQFFARYERDFCDNVDRLAETNRILYDSPDIQVIDLESGK